jgi:hypothetical protein
MSISKPLARKRLLIKNRVRLVVTNRDNHRFLRLYTATISAAFLRKFEQPSMFSDSSLVIRYTRVPFLPISHLRHGVAALVDPPIKKKKRLRELSDIMEQGACKRKKK